MSVGHSNMRNFIKGHNPGKDGNYCSNDSTALQNLAVKLDQCVKINDPIRDFSLLKQASLFLQFYKLDFFSKFYIKQPKQTCYY